MRYLILVPIFFFYTAVEAQQKTAIVHVNIVDVQKGELVKDQTVLIANEIIRDIFSSSIKKDLKGWKIIDGNGKYLIPGLIDSHIHLHYFFKTGQQQLLQVP